MPLVLKESQANSLLPRVSQSALTRYLECRMKAKLSREGWKSIRSSDPLTFGSLAHYVIEHVFRDLKRMPTEAEIKKLVDAASKEADVGRASPAQIESIEKSCRILDLELPHYFQRWRLDFVECEFSLIEAEFDLPYKNICRQYGFFDRVFRRKGKLWLTDTKTKSRIEDENIMEMLHIDFQFMYFLVALRKLAGEQPAGAVMDILRRPNLRPGKTETDVKFYARMAEDFKERPEHYFVRFEVTVDKAELDDFEKELDVLLPEYVAWRGGKIPTFKNTTACMAKGFTCEFLPICARKDYTMHQKIQGGRHGAQAGIK